MSIRDDVRQILMAAKPANDNNGIGRVQVEHSGEVTVNLVIHEPHPTPTAAVARTRSSRFGRLVLNPAPWVRAMLAREDK